MGRRLHRLRRRVGLVGVARTCVATMMYEPPVVCANQSCGLVSGDSLLPRVGILGIGTSDRPSSGHREQPSQLEATPLGVSLSTLATVID